MRTFCILAIALLTPLKLNADSSESDIAALKKIIAIQAAEISQLKQLVTKVISEDGKWIGDPTGLVGPKGATGPRGAAGPKGATGATGARGPAGPAINGMRYDATSKIWVLPTSSGEAIHLSGGGICYVAADAHNWCVKK